MLTVLKFIKDTGDIWLKWMSIIFFNIHVAKETTQFSFPLKINCPSERKKIWDLLPNGDPSCSHSKSSEKLWPLSNNPASMFLLCIGREDLRCLAVWVKLGWELFTLGELKSHINLKWSKGYSEEMMRVSLKILYCSLP